MPFKKKPKQNLKKGDNVVVTIEELIPDCLIVSLILQNKRFTGALMDTTKSGGPYGVKDNPTTIDEEKLETRNSQKTDTQKYNHKTPFPPPLHTRKSYKFDVPQPPMRNIFRRARRSRRKAKLNLIQSGRREQQRQRGWKFLSHSSECQCDECVHGVQDEKSGSSSMATKRRLKPTTENEASNSKSKRLKFQDDTPSTSGDDSDVKSNVVLEKMESPLKTLMPRKAQTQNNRMARSPMIKITFKSPGGQGKVFEIPSRLHNSPVKTVKVESQDVKQETNDTRLKSTSKQDRALKVLKRAKTQRLNKVETKPNHQRLNRRSNNNKNCHLRVLLEPLSQKCTGPKTDQLCPPSVDMYHPKNLVEVKEPRKMTKHSSTPTEPQSDPQSHSITVTSCKTPNGVFTQGDVVWGKLRGYPWWPSRITKLTTTKIDGKILQQHAEVGWFQCKTKSVIPLRSVQSFHKHFKERFQKNKKGSYKKAVAAANEASKEISSEVRKLISQFET
uniref:PWWP domain-containing protein n=1 Tax=Ciona savignyi TaxID=51511 RepID=H2Z2V2_CIOSA